MSKHKTIRHRISTIFLVVAMLAGILAASGITALADTWPYREENEIGRNQPRMLGHRFEDLRDWSPETDPYAHTMRARVPLQERIAPYADTQANPELAYGPEIMYMAGDYGNSFTQGTNYTNEFSENVLEFWQYIDYYSSWHGAAVAGTPLSLWSAEHEQAGNWTNARNFDFGSINMPNPAYTNAAHKNGVLSLGCVYFDPNNRPSQPAELMLEVDEEGNFVMAKKLIEFAKWYGFDGYFFNYEETLASKDNVDKLKEVMKQVTNAGLYTQMYDSLTDGGTIDAWGSKFEDNDYRYIDYDKEKEANGILNSVFISYDWSAGTKMTTSLNTFSKYSMSKEDIYKHVFFGVEASQGGIAQRGHNSTYNFVNSVYANKQTKELQGSVALFTADEFIHRQVDNTVQNKRAQDDYQWISKERARYYFSGMDKDPTNTGMTSSFDVPELGIKAAGGWPGVADFTTERSVTSGKVFYSGFNTGHGLEYREKGAVSNDSEWANINIQDILPTWQWWVESTGDKLGIDFDYGPKYVKKTLTGTTLEIPYTQVGGYNGGNSLAVYGNLTSTNRVHLFKTDLDTTSTTKADVTFKKTSNDTAALELAITFNNPTFGTITRNFPLENSTETSKDWVTSTIDLKSFSGNQIVGIDLVVKGTSSDFQVNLGEIKVYDNNEYTPNAPKNVSVKEAYDTNEMFISWDLDNYDQIVQYNVYAVYEDDSTSYLGGIYDEIFYVKSVEDNLKAIEVRAVGKDGSESEGSRVTYSFKNQVSDITVDETSTPKMDLLLKDNPGFFEQTTNAGLVEASWTAPESSDFDSYFLEVQMKYGKDRPIYTATASKDATSQVVSVPVFEGEEYTLNICTVKDGVKSDPVSYSGFMKDVYCAPFDGGFTRYKGTLNDKLIINNPVQTDWYKIDVKIDGVTKKFSSKYNNAFNGYRGSARLNSTSITQSNKVMAITLTDYSGNVSKTTYYDLQANHSREAIDISEIPDAAMREEIFKQVGGKSYHALANYVGNLDLSNLGIENTTGLSLIPSADKIDLSNNNFSKLEDIGLNVSSIDISGCKNIQNILIENSNVERIDYDDINNFSNLSEFISNGARLDMSDGTPEYLLAEKAKTATYDGQRPVLRVNIPEINSISVTKNKTINLNEYLEQLREIPTTARGNSASDLADASFIVDNYDFDNNIIDEIKIITFKDSANKVYVDGKIDISNAEKYEISFLKFIDQNIYGTVETMQTFYVEANKAVLETVVKKAEELVDGGALVGVMPFAVKQFNAALDNAYGVLDNLAASTSDVLSAAQKLTEAIHNLSYKVADKENLELAIELSTAFEDELDNYIEEGKSEFIEALNHARDFYDDENAFQDDVDDAYNELMEALLNLRLKADKSNLKKSINNALSVNRKLYSASSLKMLDNELVKANKVIADNSLSIADQSVVNKVQRSLDNTITNLVFKTNNNSNNNGANKLPDNDNDSGSNIVNNVDKLGDVSKETPKTGETITTFALLLTALSALFVGITLKRKVKDK